VAYPNLDEVASDVAAIKTYVSCTSVINPGQDSSDIYTMNKTRKSQTFDLTATEGTPHRAPTPCESSWSGRQEEQPTHEVDPLGGNNQRFSLAGRIQSFRHAVHGIILMLKSQHNAWVHATASFIVLLVGALLGLSPHEWCWLVIAILSVWTAEALNTALEFLANVASPEFHPLVAKAKDVAAGAVLISAIGSVVIATLVLGPYAVRFLRSIL
jgi:diacylglycerol kinase (ATP)